ncbi:hypothetical protein VFPPC_02134 [Pochonia chlamydosporia 170]|uniref:Uncharacterized protein n=1 Tax=Pochonia chlamydosporia 170 TaxID=1380566 RepID=A0A179F6Q1_METCM|nr:hypothetical protein VFPPC_02134 [Pochonia chlamydosporia 170]OAQ61118.1 hypothetical protein VFPPC_02134 [Pochonia chlamydosporia 170]
MSSKPQELSRHPDKSISGRGSSRLLTGRIDVHVAAGKRPNVLAADLARPAISGAYHASMMSTIKMSWSTESP